jgi:hypothetical protein
LLCRIEDDVLYRSQRSLKSLICRNYRLGN